MSSSKRAGIIGAIILLALTCIGIGFLTGVSASNKAISQEEQISEDQSNIDVVIQKRVDALSQMINTVKDSKKFEQDTLTQVTEARSQAESGNIEQSNLTLKAVGEAYPELKTIDLYQNVLNETATVENQIKGAREAYNHDVKSYRQFVRTWPNSMLLSWRGYDVQDYTMFTASNSAQSYSPSDDNLWDDK